MSFLAQVLYLMSVLGAIGINLYLLHMTADRLSQTIIRYLTVIFSTSIIASITWLGLSLAPTQEVAFFWTRLRLIVFAFVPLVLAASLFHYTELRHWLRWPRVGLLGIIPAVNLMFVIVDPRSDLFMPVWSWTHYGIMGVETTRFGLWQNLSGLYYLLMLFLALFLLLRRQERVSRLENLQFAWILGGIMVASLANMLRVWGLIGADQPNPTPVGMFFGGIMVWWGLRINPIADVSRIAHDVVFRSMNEAVIVLNQDERIVDYNSTALRLFPFLEGAFSQPLADFPPLEQALRTLEGDEGELQLSTGGQPRYYAVHAAAIHDKAHKGLLGKVYTLTDIDERKRTEQERERLLVTLDTYARTVAHDLKNPIGVIGGYLDLALEYKDALPEDGRLLRYLERARQSTTTMNNIVQSLLLLATLRQSERLTLHLIDMQAIVQHVITRLEFTAQQRQAQFIAVESLPAALGYAYWVEEIWLNFLSNAIKYGGTPPIITISAQATTNEQYTRYRIHDNGAGISPQDQAQLFKSFSRLERHQSVEGHGLGLVIVRQMIERMGGQVMVESAPGEGTTFSFTLPNG
jgi:signal transduction histidine kinase